MKLHGSVQYITGKNIYCALHFQLLILNVCTRQRTQKVSHSAQNYNSQSLQRGAKII